MSRRTSTMLMVILGINALASILGWERSVKFQNDLVKEIHQNKTETLKNRKMGVRIMHLLDANYNPETDPDLK